MTHLKSQNFLRGSCLVVSLLYQLSRKIHCCAWIQIWSNNPTPYTTAKIKRGGGTLEKVLVQFSTPYNNRNKEGWGQTGKGPRSVLTPYRSIFSLLMENSTRWCIKNIYFQSLNYSWLSWLSWEQWRAVHCVHVVGRYSDTREMRWWGNTFWRRHGGGRLFKQYFKQWWWGKSRKVQQT